jgi:AraC-like DNA-binding protein
VLSWLSNRHYTNGYTSALADRLMRLRRTPRSELRPYVRLLWAYDEGPAGEPSREHVLPTGDMHVVIRLSGGSLRLFTDASDRVGRTAGSALIGGPRSRFYVRQVDGPAHSVGAQLRPGAAEALFDIPAEEFSERHVDLHDVCGQEASSLQARLAEAPQPAARVDCFEAWLMHRVPRIHAMHPAVAQALTELRLHRAIADVARASGYSHKHFISLFRGTVGMAPKLYCRVLRFDHMVERAAAEPAPSLVELALEAGYSDQAHFSREFLTFAGVTPSEYRRCAPSEPRHVAR